MSSNICSKERLQACPMAEEQGTSNKERHREMTSYELDASCTPNPANIPFLAHQLLDNNFLCEK